MSTTALAIEALDALAGAGVSVADAAASVPDGPGLYAIRGPAAAWRALRLGDPPDARPLYVGKAEDSLVTRDVRTHFGTGRTGHSTLRRTVGALLAHDLQLVAQPRNPARPGHFSSYAYEPDGDARITTWMLANLRLATWSPASPAVLDEVETEVLLALLPPLNIAKVRTPWRADISAARKRMADAARRWTPPQP